MLVGIFGNLGSGKTLFLTWLLSLRKLEGFIIHTNYKCVYADVTECAELLLLHMDSLPQEPNRKYIFAIDELGQILRARDFMTTGNKILDTVFRRSRKRNCDVYYTSQSAMMVETNVRRITDIVIDCTYSRITKRVKVKIYSTCSLWGATEEKEKSIDATEMFDKYDTYEVIEPNKSAIFAELSKVALKNKEMLQMLEIAENRTHAMRIVKGYMELGPTYASMVLDLIHFKIKVKPKKKGARELTLDELAELSS